MTQEDTVVDIKSFNINSGSSLVEQSAEEVVWSPEKSRSRDDKEASVNELDDDNSPNDKSHNDDEDVVIIEVESGVTLVENDPNDEYEQLKY